MSEDLLPLPCPRHGFGYCWPLPYLRADGTHACAEPEEVNAWRDRNERMAAEVFNKVFLEDAAP